MNVYGKDNQKSRTKGKRARISDGIRYYKMERDHENSSREHFKRKPYTVARKEQV